MSYTHPSAWQWHATASDLINTRNFYQVNGVPVPVRQEDGKQLGYYETNADKEQDRNYKRFYVDMHGRTNKYGKKEYRVLRDEYVNLQQIISDKYDVITYKPDDMVNQGKYVSYNTKVSTRPPRRTTPKAPKAAGIDEGIEAYEQQLLEEAGGFVEPVTTINTSGNAYAPSFFAVIPPIPEAKAEMEAGIFTLPPVTAEPDKTTNNNMINQEILSFSIINNRVKGSIKFTATNSFNPYYYNKTITNYLQLQSKQVTLLIKTNNLRFTETERDELINFDESAFDLDIIDAQSYVWTQAHAAMSNKSTFTIQKDKPVSSSNLGFMGAGFAGGIAGLILLGFIADSRRKK